jgi:hypothetical protein
MRPIGCLTALPTSPSRGKEWVVLLKESCQKRNFVSLIPPRPWCPYLTLPREKREKKKEKGSC